MVSGVGSRNSVSNGRAHWRHLANTVDQLGVVAMSGSAIKDDNAATSQITLGNLF